MSLDADSISGQLDRICSSALFRGKPVMVKLLSYLVTEVLEGRSDQIKGYTVAVDVFGRPGSAGSDEWVVVRNNAARLRGLLNSYYLGDGRSDPIVIDLPKGRYVPRFSRNGSPTPTLTRTDKSMGDLDRGAGSDPPAVAVLPFTNLSRTPELDIYAAGFSQALADALTRFDDLRVIGVGRHDEREASMAAVADRDVGFLVEGDIQAAGTELKISFRLLDSLDKAQLWSDSKRLNMARENLFDLQEAIVNRVASLIGGEYGKVNQHRYQTILSSRPNSLDEQDILLKHYHHVTVLTDASITLLPTSLRCSRPKPGLGSDQFNRGRVQREYVGSRRPRF